MLNPAFDIHTTQYFVQVSNNTTNLNIFAVPENEKGKVTISGGENLKEGNNFITVTVTAENKITKRDYKIIAYKRNIQEEKDYEEELQKNAEKLEQAYEIEKTSTNNQESPISKIEKGNIPYIVLGIIGAILVLILLFVAYKKGIFKRK